MQNLTSAVTKSAPALAPAAVSITASWLDVIEQGLSITLLALSILFLVWRWHVQYNKDK